MRQRVLALGLLGFVGLLSPAREMRAADPAIPAERIDAHARPLVDGGHVVGCVVGVASGDATRVQGYGRLAADAERAPDGATVYEIGSISKTFTGILLALAVGDGRVALDDPLQSLLPADKARVPLAFARPITLADVATHSSGLPRMPTNFAPADPRNPYADYSVERMYAFLDSCAPARAPGADYEYSNFAMGLLGHALALKAGSSYEDLLVARIATPLGMASTRIAFTPDMTKRLAPPHDAARRPAANWDIPTLAGAGGIRSSADDMLRFLAANWREGAETPLGKALALARTERWRKPDGSVALGLGWHLADGGATAWHNGETGGYHSFAAIDPARKLAVVVLANTATGRVDEVGRAVLRVLHGEDVAPATPPVEVTVAREKLEPLVGRYGIGPAFVMAITLEDGRLHVQATGQPKFPLFAASESEFFLKVVEARLAFSPVDATTGHPPSVTLHQNGLAQTARRLDT